MTSSTSGINGRLKNRCRKSVLQISKKSTIFNSRLFENESQQYSRGPTKVMGRIRVTVADRTVRVLRVLRNFVTKFAKLRISRRVTPIVYTRV